MSILPLGKGRITGNLYLTATEMQRNALVAGLADMLDLTVLYASATHKAQIEALAIIAGKNETSGLRELLDTYVTADDSRREYLIASNFLALLREIANTKI